MYHSHFGLNETPFSIAPDPLYLYMSEHHREALAHLKYGVMSECGFVLLTGEVGAGKTTLCRSLLEQLPDNVIVAYVLNPKVSVIELLETICDELRIDRPEQGSIKKLVDLLNAYLLESNAHGRKIVLIIDEAQNLCIDVLEQLRLLTNLETNRYKLLQIVLLGQPELLQIINQPEMRQLSQRVTTRYHLGALGAEEINAYICHRLNIAGCNRLLFPESLSKTLWQLTGGIPRLINLVCDRALLGAYALERKQVDNKILCQAAGEVLGSHQATKKSNAATVTFGLTCIVLLLLIAGVWSGTFSSFATVTQMSSTEAGAPELTQTTDLAEKTSNPVLAPVSSPDKKLLNVWPKEFAMTQSINDAFDDLAGLWGLAPADRLDFYSYATQNGLSYLLRKDSLETLRNINRPAILKLYDDNGIPFHMVMSVLGQDRAILLSGATEYDLSLSALTSRWFGEYFLLWKKPQLQKGFLSPGGAGDSVNWLAETLQGLGLYEATGREVRLEGTLLFAFKGFQLSSNLTPDGVLGTMSLIHLNTARSLAGPRLYPQGAS